MFRTRDDALEEIGAEYPDLAYAGTIILSASGGAPAFEDWSGEAHQRAVNATDDWLEEQRESRAYLARVL